MVTVRIVPSKPALIVEDKERHVVVADLHIGFESRLAANSVFLGKGSTVGETIAEIREIIVGEGIGSLILLGDIKSSVGSITRAEWDDVPVFFEEMRKIADVSLIPGNHDANIQRLVPDGVTLAGPAGLILGNTLLTHGHAMPSENFSHVERIIMGHMHPVFFEEGSVLNGQRVWVQARAQRQDLFPSARGEIELLLIPSFNRYFYAAHRQRRKRSISPIIGRIKKFGSARIVTLDGSVIGGEDVLDRVI